VDFEVKLPLFEGPFDLLLFFIERDELDIQNIPISEITSDFLRYIKHLEKMDIEVASEFILVAASLMRIKAKLLVPRPDVDDKGKEIDPRQELVQKLLEYKKYKSVVNEMTEMESNMLAKEKRGNIVKEITKLAEQNDVETELQNIDLYKLLKVYQRTIEKFDNRKTNPHHQVVQYPYTIADQKEMIMDKVQVNDKLAFTTIIQENSDKIAVIFNFLSILELLQLNYISITLGEGYNNFWISSKKED
jgi:segregation and condensation protein A